ncbi:MAG: beta-ketoacyl-ACP synthase II [Planctomycetes bacterium]|nr:beta-ketoacyl-ACP synthase II [Planctomycetota bacterium]MBU4398379.1 beta-ketoacyl-ACP synthase II [Planctomycetota bacterium]MCG2683378.1 beta-ketoacyl-ACP synthase II [Planctomycetales bacterium]
MKRRVVVTGIGAVTSLGCKVDELWTRICNGESGIGPLERLDVSNYRVRIGGEVRNWSVEGYIESKDVKRFDRFVQFAHVAGVNAVSDSGIDFSNDVPWRCGVVIGSGIGGLETIEIQHERLLNKGPSKVSAFTIPKLIGNAASAQLAIQYGLRGPNQVVVTACASATNAIGDAFKLIRDDEVDVMITGGSEAALTHIGVSAFAAMRALSERNDDPTRASRPFDRDRDGFVLSEGAGMLVIEELEHAKARGANIYGEIFGYGVSCDAGHITAPNRNGAAAAYAMAGAIKNAGLTPADIDYINAHGTSTQLNDVAETAAIKTVFGDHAYKVSISSTKSQLGHLLGASGGVELILSLLAIRDGVVPPTINYETPDPECDLDYTPNQARRRDISAAMSNSFGFGGHNGSLVFGKLRNG